MEQFFINLKKAAVNVWTWFKSLPIVKPLYLLLYSRKSAITAALVAFALEGIPRLAPVKAEVEVLIAQVVVIALAAVANVLGIAWEDSAEKIAGRDFGGKG